jgi:hypothetical protein
VTYFGVQPGDDLTVLDTTDLSASSDVSVVTPAEPTDGAPYAYYGVNVGSCSQTSVTGQVFMTLGPGCYGQGFFPALAVEQNQACMIPPCLGVGYAFQKAASLATIPDGGMNPTADLSSATWNTDIGTQTITGVNAPPSLASSSSILSYTEFADGVGFTERTVQPSFNVDGGVSVSAPFETHPQYPDFVQSEVDILAPASASGISLASPYYSVIRRTTKPSGSESLDLSKLPPLMVTAGADFSNTSPSLSWVTTGPVPSSVGTIVTLQFTSLGSKWTFIVPPGVTSIRAPNVPPAVLALLKLPSSASSPQISWNVATLSGGGLADYAALRKAAGTMNNVYFNYGSCDATGTLVGPILPANGDLVITGFLSFDGSGCG